MEKHKIGDEVSVKFEIIAVYSDMVKCKNKNGTVFCFNNSVVNKPIKELDMGIRDTYKPGDKVLAEFEVVKVTYEGYLECKSKADGTFNLSLNSIEKPFEPREMMVSNSGVETAYQKKKVIDMWQGYYITSDASVPSLWAYAKELPKELENGKVYKSLDSECIYYKTGDNTAFGFNKTGQYMGVLTNMKWICNFTEYPLQDFKKLMIEEAKKRFKKDDWVDRKELGKIGSRCVELEHDDIEVFTTLNFDVVMNGKIIFRNGIWATIIE